MQENKSNQITEEQKDIDNNNFPDFQNVVNFFALLLKVDMRENPQNYQIKNNNNDRYSDTIDTKISSKK